MPGQASYESFPSLSEAYQFIESLVNSIDNTNQENLYHGIERTKEYINSIPKKSRESRENKDTVEDINRLIALGMIHPKYLEQGRRIQAANGLIELTRRQASKGGFSLEDAVQEYREHREQQRGEAQGGRGQQRRQ